MRGSVLVEILISEDISGIPRRGGDYAECREWRRRTDVGGETVISRFKSKGGVATAHSTTCTREGGGTRGLKISRSPFCRKRRERGCVNRIGTVAQPS